MICHQNLITYLKSIKNANESRKSIKNARQRKQRLGTLKIQKIIINLQEGKGGPSIKEGVLKN